MINFRLLIPYKVTPIWAAATAASGAAGSLFQRASQTPSPAHVPRMTWVAQGKLPQMKSIEESWKISKIHVQTGIWALQGLQAGQNESKRGRGCNFGGPLGHPWESKKPWKEQKNQLRKLMKIQNAIKEAPEADLDLFRVARSFKMRSKMTP